MNMKNSIAAVTGANRGVGKALVDALLQQGVAKVYATARDKQRLPNFDDARVIPITLDVTNADSIKAACGQMQDITLLFNNAGVLSFGDILSVPESDIKKNLDVNFFGALNMCRAAVPILEANSKGDVAIINVLTLLSLASMPGLAAYNAAKAAAWSMTLSLRASLQPKNIRVHSVFPGAIDTDMLAGVDIEKTSASDVAQNILTGIVRGDEDITPDPMSQQVHSLWLQNSKSVEKQFAEM